MDKYCASLFTTIRNWAVAEKVPGKKVSSLLKRLRRHQIPSFIDSFIKIKKIFFADFLAARAAFLINFLCIFTRNILNILTVAFINELNGFTTLGLRKREIFLTDLHCHMFMNNQWIIYKCII